MRYTEQQVRDIIRQTEEKYPEVPKGTLLKLHGIETAGDANKVNPNAADLTSPAGAVGWFQFTDPTAKAYKINPRDLPQAADGAARYIRDNLRRFKGDMAMALVEYNGGGRAVSAYANGKPFDESKGYLTKFFGSEPEVSKKAAVATDPFSKGQSNMNRAAQLFNEAPRPQATNIDTTLQTVTAAANLSQQQLAQQAEGVSSWEAIGYGFSQNLSAAVFETFSAKDDPNFVFGEKHVEQANAAGAGDDPKFLRYVEGATSEDDFSFRLGQVATWRDTEARMANETGLSFAATQAAVMLGSMADPVAAAATVAAGAGLAAIGVGAAQTAGAAALRGVAEGFISNAATDYAIQSMTRTETDWNGVVQQGIVGAAFSAAATVGTAAYKAANTAMKLRAVGNEADAVMLDEVATDVTTAAQPVAAKIESAVTTATDNADAVVADAVRGVETPQARATEPASVFEQPAKRGISASGHGEMNKAVRAIQSEIKGTLGLEVSVEAAEVTRRAADWSEEVGAAGADMQARLQKWYNARDLALDKTATNVAKVIDSMGLTLARSESKVVRWAASHLLEVGSGLGKREVSAAIAFDQMNMNLQHRYVPAIIQRMVDSMDFGEKASFYTGWGVDGQRRVGREVAVYREAKRQAVRAGLDMQKWSHPASPKVKEIGDLLDRMGMDIRDMMRSSGHPDADLLDGSLAIGYRQYSWDWRQLQAMLHDSDPQFGKFVNAIQAEFREQVMLPALEEYRATGLERDFQAHVNMVNDNLAVATEELARGGDIKRIKGMQLQVGKWKAAKARLEADNGAAVRAELYARVEKKWLEKANTKASYYVRQIVQDPKSRAEGSLMHLSDIAADLLREEAKGGIVTDEVVDTFAEQLTNIINDRTRREINLLRPVGDKLVLDFLSNNDPVGQVKTLASRHARQAAMAKTLGVHTEFDVRGVLEAARVDGASPDEIEQLTKAFDVMLGKYDEVEPALVQAAKDMAHAAYMGGQGFSNLSDVSAMFGSLGLVNGIKAAGRTLKEIAVRGEDTELMKQMADIAAGTLGTDYRLNYVLPESDISGAVAPDDAGRFGRVARRAAQATSYVSLANRVNAAMHRAFVPQLAELLVSKVGVADDVRMTDLGLDPAWQARVRAMLDKHDAKRGLGDRINFDAWEDQAAADRMVTAIHRGTAQTIQKAMIGERPAWAELSLLGRIAGQFRSFGMTAAEKQLVRSAGLGDSNATVQAAFGLAWAGALYYARVQAQTVGMDEAQRREFLDKRLSGPQAISGVLNFWNMSGIASDVGGLGMAMFGATPARGSGIASIDWAQQALRAPGKLMEGDETAVKVLPFGNTLPMLGILNTMADDDE